MNPPVLTARGVTVYHGDCLDVLRELPDASVDAVVTDPPYGLEFMGKEWDAPWKQGDDVHADARTRRADEMTDESKRRFIAASVNKFAAGLPFQQWCELWAVECLRVLKPGGHLLAFGGSRTWHRLACAVEDAGFEIRDSIAWLYGSGFPKSLDVSKAIDKAAGAEREVIGPAVRVDGKPRNYDEWAPHRTDSMAGTLAVAGPSVTAPATPDAERWQGWGTALKPAFEPIVVARKPLVGTVAGNVLAWGTGALNIDACRIAGEPRPLIENAGRADPRGEGFHGKFGSTNAGTTTTGRWPANVVLDESQAAELDHQSGTTASKRSARGAGKGETGIYGAWGMSDDDTRGHDDEGGASRFFYIAREDKQPCIETPTTDAYTNNAPAADSEPKLTTLRTPADGASTIGTPSTNTTSPTDDLTARFLYTAKADASERPRVDGIAHPTVKPLTLMRWLVRLVTPPGGVVLEPFAGSGTTVEACILEGFQCIAIEREADYIPTIELRVTRQLDPVRAIELKDEDPGLFALLDEEPA